MGLHVDDYLGAGEGVNGAGDLEGDYDDSFASFRDRLCGLSRRFRFGSWDFGPVIRFCGADVEQSLANDSLTISMKEYVKRVHPITIEKSRKAMPNEPCDEKEHRCLRALVGAFAWPANQCMPQLSASVSILQASVAKPQIKDVNESNKLLRFAKNVAQEYKMKMIKHAYQMKDVKFSVFRCGMGSSHRRNQSRGLHDFCSQRRRTSRWPADESHHRRLALKEIGSHVQVIFGARSSGISSSGG